jgi:hypothetical protein
MEKTLDEKLLSPTQSYSSFEEWEKEFTANYLSNNPRKTQDDLMFDQSYNKIRSGIWNKFVALKNGTEYTEPQESDASKSYWNWRDSYEDTMNKLHEGKTPDQVIMESMQKTREHIQAEKLHDRKQSADKIAALRALYNICNPRPSDRFKNN